MLERIVADLGYAAGDREVSYKCAVKIEVVRILERACLVAAEVDSAPCCHVADVNARKSCAVLESTDTGCSYAGTYGNRAHA